jgi:holliday junction DNA helicase RuvB
MKEERIITANETNTGSPDPAIRPKLLEDFIGQKQAKQNLKIFLEAAKKRGDAIDHILLYGPPGLGKTTIAGIISHEMEVNFKATAGPILTKAGDLAAILSNLKKGDILFIDEIHRMNSSVEEILYSAMEDFKLDIIIGEGPAARTVRIDLPHFTLVGATTRMGLISGPLRDRFGIPLRLKFYEVSELSEVIKRGANILHSPISDDGAMEIAKRSRGTPRIAIRLLRRVRDFITVSNDIEITKHLANQALLHLEVDHFGLDSLDRRYLQFIADNYGTEAVGIETIAAGLSEQKNSIEETIEPYLIQQGFINKTPRGRVLTEKALTAIDSSNIKKA